MPKEYKEIKLFNGMSMSLDANDIPETTAQIAINTKDLANGKLDSEYTLNSASFANATVGGYKIKRINDLVQILNNSGDSVLVYNVNNNNSPSGTVLATGDSYNSNIENVALDVKAGSFSEYAKMSKFGKQARISDINKQPKFIGYVNQQGKTSLVTEQNSDTIIYENDAIPSISSFEADATSVCVSIANPKVVFFTNKNSNKLSCMAIDSTVTSMNALTVYETPDLFGSNGERYEIQYVTQDEENATASSRYLYIIAENKSYTIGSRREFKIMRIDQSTLLTLSDIPNGINQIKTNGSILATCSFRCLMRDITSVSLKVEIASMKVTNSYVYISFYRPIDTSFFKTINNTATMYQKTITQEVCNENGGWMHFDMLFRIPKSFSNNASYTTSDGSAVRSLLPFSLTQINTNDTNILSHYEPTSSSLNVYFSKSEVYVIPGTNFDSACSADMFADALLSYFKTNKATICTGLSEDGHYYYYYPIPDTAILRGNGRFSSTGKNNLSVLSYSGNLVGQVWSGYTNGSTLKTEGLTYESVWSTDPPDTWTPPSTFICNGWIVFKIDKSDSTITINLVNGVPRSKWDSEAPKTSLGTEPNNYIRHANHYMLCWNGVEDNVGGLTPLPSIIYYDGTGTQSVSSSDLTCVLSFPPSVVSTSFSNYIFRKFYNNGTIIKSLVIFESDAVTDTGDEKGFINCIGKINMAQKTDNNIIVSGETVKCYYTTNFQFITGKGTIEPLGNQAYTLPLAYSYFSDGGETSNRTTVQLTTLLTSSPYYKYIFGKTKVFQYENGIGFNLPEEGGSDYIIIDNNEFLVTTKGVPFLQRLLRVTSNETFGTAYYSYVYTVGSSEYLSLFQSAFVNVSFNGITGSESDTVVYEKGYKYKFKMTFIYDGYQESPLSPTYKTFDADQDYASMDIKISLHPDFFSQVSKRVTAMCLYVAKYSQDIQIELFRLVKEFKLNTEDFSSTDKTTSYSDTGNRYGSYEANTGISERTASVSLLYAVSHVYNGCLYVGDISHATEPINQKEYILCKSQPGKLSIFDYANNFSILPFSPKVITSFNYKLYVFGNEGFCIVNPDTLAIELTSNIISCSNPDYVCSTPLGLFVYQNKKVYSVNNNNVEYISGSIERSDGDVYSGLNNLLVSKLYFNNKTNSLCVLGSLTVDKTYMRQNKYIIFSFSFDNKIWRIIDHSTLSTSSDGSILSEYSIDGIPYLFKYNTSSACQSLFTYTGTTPTLANSLYVSKKIYVNSEFLSQFLYKLKINAKAIKSGTSIKVYGYYNNQVVNSGYPIITTTLSSDSSFVYESNAYLALKINYIIITIYGSFEEIQSIGMLVRGLIR